MSKLKYKENVLLRLDLQVSDKFLQEKLFAAVVGGIINKQLNTVAKSSNLILHVRIETKFKTLQSSHKMNMV